MKNLTHLQPPANTTKHWNIFLVKIETFFANIIHMKSLIDFSLSEEYEKVKRLGDKLAQVDSLINWGAFIPTVAGMYGNMTEKWWRPHMDEVLMIKMLVLRQWYGLPDPELERQATDRIFFSQIPWFS
ncbi:MAG: hypothetical protein AEth_01013 [Candidatus Argoarchaeum ethanivorans]|uniref:Transposase InsH N-terminal domain-containing protein n=1 Tax=Candidatus Argoarchaeum ethanivorans TaxID=2608793 RepID=A0A8B3S3D7_9EURY|nr:MAG: hypothetical protein AEth_01013 [Candidatus Argoarchaeum ethanivorans]